MKNTVVYTAICGGYDTLKQPSSLWSQTADFIAYLDRPQLAQGWEMRGAALEHVDPTRNAKRHKIVPEDLFSTYEYSVWIDGSVGIKSQTGLDGLLREWLQSCDLALFRHRRRRCIYEEADACVAAGKDDPATIRRQVDEYRLAGYPENNGLHECTILVRRHTPAITAFCRAWHQEICRHSRRDQLSFNYVAHRAGLRCFELPGTIMKNDHFAWYYHDGGSGTSSLVV